MRLNRFISSAFVCAAIATGSACSATFSAGTSLSEAKVEKQLTQILEEKTGTKPDNVDCPDDLQGKKGAVMTCSVSAVGQTHDVKLTVTEVDGSDIGFRWEVVEATGSDGPTDSTVDELSLEQKVADVLEQEVGQRPDSVDCPGVLKGKIGETMRCTLKAGADELGLTVTVTAVQGSTVDFDVEVDG